MLGEGAVWHQPRERCRVTVIAECDFGKGLFDFSSNAAVFTCCVEERLERDVCCCGGSGIAMGGHDLSFGRGWRLRIACLGAAMPTKLLSFG